MTLPTLLSQPSEGEVVVAGVIEAVEVKEVGKIVEVSQTEVKVVKAVKVVGEVVVLASHKVQSTLKHWKEVVTSTINTVRKLGHVPTDIAVL